MIMHILIICLGLFLLKFIWQPWRKHQWYTQNFENQGYRVMEVPFKPLSFPAIKYKYYDFSDKAKDSYAAVKKEYLYHDVVVFNALNKSVDFTGRIIVNVNHDTMLLFFEINWWRDDGERLTGCVRRIYPRVKNPAIKRVF